MSTKPRRRQRIAELIAGRGVASQEQLQNLLAADGIAVTQATLSRDLRDLGVMKGPGGYILPGDSAAAEHTPAVAADLQSALKSFLVRAESGGNIVVLRTGPGRAQSLALDIDKAQLPPVIGTVAGDDTILVAARTPQQAGRLKKQLKQLAGLA